MLLRRVAIRPKAVSQDQAKKQPSEALSGKFWYIPRNPFLRNLTDCKRQIWDADGFGLNYVRGL